MKQRYTSIPASLLFSSAIFRPSIWSRVPFPRLKPACSSGNSAVSLFCIWLAMIFNKILLLWLIKAMVRLLLHSNVSPILGSITNIDVFQSSGHSLRFQISMHRLWKFVVTLWPPFIKSSAGMSSISGDFPTFPTYLRVGWLKFIFLVRIVGLVIRSDIRFFVKVFTVCFPTFSNLSPFSEHFQSCLWRHQ